MDRKPKMAENRYKRMAHAFGILRSVCREVLADPNLRHTCVVSPEGPQLWADMARELASNMQDIAAKIEAEDRPSLVSSDNPRLVAITPNDK